MSYAIFITNRSSMLHSEAFEVDQPDVARQAWQTLRHWIVFMPTTSPFRAEISGGEITECEKCESIWLNDELKEILDLRERVAPGEPMPYGECPDCGALCHAFKE